MIVSENAAPDNPLLLAMLEQLRDDFADERTARRDENEAARQSRAATHGRIDEVIERLGRLDTSVALAGQAHAQVHGELEALKHALADIAPTIDEWRRIRRLGLGIVGLITAGGLSIGAALSWSGDAVAGWVRAWLRIH